MRWRLALLPALLLAVAPAQADEIRCLTGGNRAQIHLAWMLPADGKPVSFVRYAGKTQWLRLTRLRQEGTELAEGRPWQFDAVWEEHLDGKVVGHYAVSTQGARIYAFQYTNARNGRQTDFSEDLGAMTETGCHWE
ncbi:hypothetical protein KQ945_12845 [Bacillus subtilis subsp. subtilis]|nr:hypothetical protein [Bacillus subtilis subsp. subtilis]